MAKILKKYEFGGKGNYIYVEVDEFDFDEIERIDNHNRSIWREDKRRQRYLSKESLDARYESSNFEPMDTEQLDPLTQMLEEYEEHLWNKSLSMLKDAMKCLTTKQFIIVMSVSSGVSIRKVAKLEKISYATAHKHYNAGLFKLRIYYRQFPELKDVYPHLFED